MNRLFLVIILVFSGYLAEAQFAYRLTTPLAAESFRTGVEAYGRGRYAEALAQFERSLASQDDDPLSLYWLGKAYYRLGLPVAAFDRWNEAIALAGSSPFVSSRLELADAFADPLGLESPTRYVRVSELSGTSSKQRLFSRPSWIETLPDGKAIIVSHGTNTLLVLDANARIVQTINGGSTGFDRPFACLRLDDGTMLVSEFQADRIARFSPDGRLLGYLGSANGTGKLSGPQYMAVDKDGFIYVCDVGFSRVAKFSPDGTLVLSFGSRSLLFEGLRIPTGIAALEDRLYIADAALKGIFVFDTYGNFIARLETPGLMKPEGLKVSPDGRLLVADGSRVLLIDPETGAQTELYRSERKKARIVSASFDANGELLVADFDASEVAWLSDPASRFAGLSTEIGRINSDAFPRVSFEIRVKDRHGRPLTGLDFSNFYISEGFVLKERRTEGDKQVDYLASSIRPAANMTFDGSLDSSKRLDLVFLLAGGPELSTSRLETRDAASAVYASLGADASARLVVAGKTAQPPSAGTIGAISDVILKAEPTTAWRFDTGLRLAAGALFETSGRRVVVYLGSGSVNELHLGGSSLSEMVSLLAANDTSLYAVIIGKGQVSEALNYLVTSSGGQIYRSDRAEGLAVLAEHARAARTGRYRLSFTATADDGFGRTYLPFSVEVYLRDRSGKDEGGYFAPLR